MKPELLVITGLFLCFIVLEMCFSRFFSKKGQQPGDAKVEIISTATLMFVTQPLVLFLSFAMASQLFPDYQNRMEHWHVGVIFGCFLIFDDMTQYWWHRLSHTVPWLYKLHRPHHEANYMSIRIVYRNNLFYYLLMPGIWFSGVLIYLGGASVYAVYIVIKMLVIFGAHSDMRWDSPLYRVTWLSPLIWLLERTISTPATHSAHHGLHADDGVTHYKGNYGNLLFLWDVLFGTAKITRRYPKAFGVENMPDTSVAEQLWWPLVDSERKGSRRSLPSD